MTWTPCSPKTPDERLEPGYYLCAPMSNHSMPASPQIIRLKSSGYWIQEDSSGFTFHTKDPRELGYSIQYLPELEGLSAFHPDTATVEPVREWTKFVQKELAPDFLTNLNWVSSQAEAEAQEVPPGYIRLAIACRERQPDGTWRAVSDNPVQRIMASQKDAPAEEMTTNQDPIGGCYDRR